MGAAGGRQQAIRGIGRDHGERMTRV
jgi:hypothetical protein